jgi:hypothetical protein
MPVQFYNSNRTPYFQQQWRQNGFFHGTNFNNNSWPRQNFQGSRFFIGQRGMRPSYAGQQNRQQLAINYPQQNTGNPQNYNSQNFTALSDNLND